MNDHRSRRRFTLTLSAAAAALLLVGCASETASPVGTWGDEGGSAPFITIEDDGSFHGSDGCNVLTGSGTISGDTIDLGEFAVTLKACEGVDTWLSQGRTARASGDVLTVSDADGEQIGTLAR